MRINLVPSSYRLFCLLLLRLCLEATTLIMSWALSCVWHVLPSLSFRIWSCLKEVLPVPLSLLPLLCLSSPGLCLYLRLVFVYWMTIPKGGSTKEKPTKANQGTCDETRQDMLALSCLPLPSSHLCLLVLPYLVLWGLGRSRRVKIPLVYLVV